MGSTSSAGPPPPASCRVEARARQVALVVVGWDDAAGRLEDVAVAHCPGADQHGALVHFDHVWGQTPDMSGNDGEDLSPARVDHWHGAGRARRKRGERRDAGDWQVERQADARVPSQARSAPR